MRERLPLYRNVQKWTDYVPPADVPTDQLWTADQVKDRLVEAARLIERTGGRVAPREPGSTMPDYSYDWGDLIGQSQSATLYKGGNRVTIGASSRAISRCEQAMRWPIQYLEEVDGPRRVLRLFLRCRALRVPFNAAIKQKGWSRATAFRARDRALAIIAVGLIKDRVPLVRAGEDDDDGPADE